MTRHSVNNNTCMDLVIFLYSNANHLISLIPPKTASNFRHLLSCGTIDEVCQHKIIFYVGHLQIVIYVRILSWLSSRNFFSWGGGGGGEIYCYANFYCYCTVFGPNFREGRKFSGGSKLPQGAPPAPLWKKASFLENSYNCKSVKL